MKSLGIESAAPVYTPKKNGSQSSAEICSIFYVLSYFVEF